MAGPRHAVRWRHDRDLGLGPRLALDQPHRSVGEPARQLARPRHGGRQADAPRLGRQRRQPRQVERQQIAALVVRQRMRFVDDHGREAGEQFGRIVVRQEDRQRLGRGHQYMRRLPPLAHPLRLRRVAGPRLGPDLELHLGDRRFEVAVDVDRERLQGRDVERVKPFARVFRQIDQRRQEACQRLAAAGRRDQQRVLAGARGLQHGKLMRMRRPAARGEPVPELPWERRGQGVRALRGGSEGVHGLRVAARHR